MAGFAKPNSDGPLSYKEATAALHQICQGGIPNATPGLVQVLLDNDADVLHQRRKSTNLMKRMLNQNQEDIRSSLFEDATRNCSADILMLIARRADELALNQALPIALDQQNAEKVRILLDTGADASQLCHGFRRAVESGSDDLVEILLRQVRGACQACRDLGLVDAARLGYANKAKSLLACGAAPSFQQGAALVRAIQAGHEDAAIAIASSEGIRAHTELLDFAVGEAYAEAQYAVLRRCLQAGARGMTTDKTLVHAIRHRHCKTARLLVQHQASVNRDSGAAVICAIESCDPSLLQIVLGGEPSLSTLSAAVLRTAKITNVKVAYHMIEFLLDAGVHGDCLSQVLVRCLDRGSDSRNHETTCLPLIRLLLEKGRANVNFEDGKALVLAVKKAWVETLDLLVHCQPSVPSLKAALDTAMGRSDPDVKNHAIGLLLKATSNDPAANRCLNSIAIKSAATSLDYRILQFLAETTLSEADVLIGFHSATSTVHWTTPTGLQVIQYLLGMGASGSHVDQAFCQAVAMFSQDAIDLLADYVSPTAFSSALESITKNSKNSNWCKIQCASLVNSFIENGASKDAVNNALINAVDAAVSGGGAVLVIETLLGANSIDVNFQSGAALRIAIQAGNADVLSMLLESGADLDTATRAFYQAITFPLDEDTVLRLLDVMNPKGGPSCCPAYQTVTPGHAPPILRCVATHPTSAKLVERLAQLGCNMGVEFQAKPYDIEEPATMLVRAMMPFPGGKVASTGVVEALINAQVNVNYVTKYSKTTPLILAAWQRRTDMVKLLIKAGAKTDHRDCYNRSALYYASSAGDLDAVNLLLKPRHKLNDGSLHEAARNLHSDVVAALIKKKHDVNFPSSLPEHQGRTPLQELAYQCDCQGKVTEAEATIHAIQEGQVNLFDQWRGKNALFLALENRQPVPVTRALLDTIFWREIDNGRNAITVPDPETGLSRYMSPTYYLKASMDKGNWDRNQQLLQLLQTKNASDRYYAPPTVPWVSPEDIAQEDKRLRDEEEKRYNREFEHEQKLRRQWEEGQNSALIEEMKVAKKLEGSRAIHGNELQRKGELMAQQLHLSNRVHNNQMWQSSQNTSQQQDALRKQNLLLQQDRQITAKQQQEDLRQKNLLSQQSKQKIAEIEQRDMMKTALISERYQRAEMAMELQFTKQSNQEKLRMMQAKNKLSKAPAQQRQAG
ncbi:ankyrin [Apiospora kogelbergensis]|uniref:ankyrin n=1 Tax=Apiospora kogelbergensis TaxID=1337665 RepID=UPI00312FC87D